VRVGERERGEESRGKEAKNREGEKKRGREKTKSSAKILFPRFVSKSAITDIGKIWQPVK